MNTDGPRAVVDRNQVIYYEPLMDTIEHECLAAGADNMQRILLWIMECRMPETATASGGSAVSWRFARGNEAMRKFFAKKQENER